MKRHLLSPPPSFGIPVPYNSRRRSTQSPTAATVLKYSMGTDVKNATVVTETTPAVLHNNRIETTAEQPKLKTNPNPKQRPQSPSLFEVTSPYSPTGDQPEAIDRLLKQIRRGDEYSILRGITGTGKTFVMAQTLARLGNRPALILCHNKTLAAQLARELRSLLQKNQVHLFVSYYNHYVPESYNEKIGKFTSKRSAISQELNALRHMATKALVQHSDTVIVASISCIYGLGLPSSYLDAAFTWQVGGGGGGGTTTTRTRTSSGETTASEERYTHDEIVATLQGGMYTCTSSAIDGPTSSSKKKTKTEKDITDVEHGEYHLSQSSSGGISVVFYPPTEPSPVRVNFDVWGGKEKENGIGIGIDSNDSTIYYTISSIVGISPKDCRELSTKESITVFPARHHAVGSDEERFEESLSRIQEELVGRVKELKADSKIIEADRLSQRVGQDLMLLRETGNCNGIENYSRHLALREEGAAPDTLLDYFGSENFLVFVDESHVALPQLAAMYRGDRARKKMLVKHGYRLPSALDNRPLKEGEFWDRVSQTIFVSATPGKKETNLISTIRNNDPVEMIIRPTFVCDPPIEVRPKKNQLDNLVSEIKTRIQKNERSLVLTLTKVDAEDLSSFLLENGVASTYIHCGLNTRERSNALQSLQLGEIDCLVGVNLLREGLDLPEVSLVAILNADAEGFLRSETALLQTIGRAARNENGRAILYANRVTDSMSKCIVSTERRRKLQLAYNEQNHKKVKTTKGSSFAPIFDLLSDQIEQETSLEGGSSSRLAVTTNSMEPKIEISTIDAGGTKHEMNLDRLPKKPGVYFWKDGESNILYIGKAKQLRNRVLSYVRPGAKHGSRIKAMLAKSKILDFVITPTERDALLLEANLISHHKPLYNVLLKNDESYPYICACIGDEFPEFRIVPRRQIAGEADKYKYFGPYPHYSDITAILEGIEETYGLRSMRFNARFGKVNKERYASKFDQAFREVFQATEDSRNQPLFNIRSKGEEASIIFDSDCNKSRDVVVAIESKDGSDEAIVLVLQLRQGLVMGLFSYTFELGQDVDMTKNFAEAIETILIERHYPSGEASQRAEYSFFPDDVLVQYPVSSLKDLKGAIRSSRDEVEVDRKGSKISVRRPASVGGRGKIDTRVLNFALQNAEQVARDRGVTGFNCALPTSVDGTAAVELANLLSLEKAPEKIECFDISHLQGEAAVGSRVVFVNGRPQSHLYRRFNVKTVEETRDDYANLEEVISRRFLRARSTRGLVENDDPWSVPDIVVIDGGKGQLTAALKGMAKAHFFPSNIHSTVGDFDDFISEEMKRPSDLDSSLSPVFVAVIALAKSEEEVFQPGSKHSLNERADSPGLLLLRAIRDESHRFAVSSHKKQRSRIMKS